MDQGCFIRRAKRFSWRLKSVCEQRHSLLTLTTLLAVAASLLTPSQPSQLSVSQAVSVIVNYQLLLQWQTEDWEMTTAIFCSLANMEWEVDVCQGERGPFVSALEINDCSLNQTEMINGLFWLRVTLHNYAIILQLCKMFSCHSSTV